MYTSVPALSSYDITGEATRRRRAVLLRQRCAVLHMYGVFFLTTYPPYWTLGSMYLQCTGNPNPLHNFAGCRRALNWSPVAQITCSVELSHTNSVVQPNTSSGRPDLFIDCPLSSTQLSMVLGQTHDSHPAVRLMQDASCFSRVLLVEPCRWRLAGSRHRYRYIQGAITVTGNSSQRDGRILQRTASPPRRQLSPISHRGAPPTDRQEFVEQTKAPCSRIRQ